MANKEQLAILKQGIGVWNKWREEYPNTEIHLSGVDLSSANLKWANLVGADFTGANLNSANLREANLRKANLSESSLCKTNLSRCILREAKLFRATLTDANLTEANLFNADLTNANLVGVDFSNANLVEANLSASKLSNSLLFKANLTATNLRSAFVQGANFTEAKIGWTIFGTLDLSDAIGLEKVVHLEPSVIGIDTIRLSKGKIATAFLRGCGLSDWEIESANFYNPDLNNNQFLDIQNSIFDLRNRQALQISPLFISYSRSDSNFVDKLENQLNKKGIRFWRDIHDMKSGRMEKQIDKAIRLNPTVLLILSKHSLQSDWVEHEVRTARALEKEMKRDALCPVSIDDSWKNSPWSKRIMEQVMEYNILDFSAWKDDSRFENTFNKLIGGLELFYK
jgi:uncharacterized protein YjbI with pentapeptide repeats